MVVEPIRDRTDQFRSILKRTSAMLGRSGAVTTFSSKPKSEAESRVVGESKRIHNLAKLISEQLAFCDLRIVQLLDLAQKTSNFRDERSNMLALINDLKKDVRALNTNIHSLSHFIHSSFSKKTAAADDCAKHHYSLLDILRLKHSSCAKAFANACTVSTKAMQKQKQEKERFGLGAKYAAQSTSFRSVPRNRLQRRVSGIDVKSEQESKPLLSEFGAAVRQSQSQMQLQRESQYNEQRAKEAQSIERTLTEISQSMTQLANLVDEQRETIIDINENMEVAVEHMEGGIEQLQKYLASLTGNRWLMIKVFALIIFFAILFTVFIA